jgi:hypothetical protein
MPIISISQDELDRQAKVEPGFYVATLRDVTEKANKDKTGTNFIFDFQVTSEGANTGRHVTTLVSSKAIGLGMIPIVCALEDIEPSDFTPQDVNTDKLLGKSCFIEVEHEIYEGRIQVRIKNLFPISTNGITVNNS